MNNCREEFEDWLANQIGADIKDGTFDTGQHGQYKSFELQDLWVAYKAGWERHQELSE